MAAGKITTLGDVHSEVIAKFKMIRRFEDCLVQVPGAWKNMLVLFVKEECGGIEAFQRFEGNTKEAPKELVDKLRIVQGAFRTQSAESG